MTTEIYWLTATAVMTALLWVPHILSLIFQMGFWPALMDGEHETPLASRWAQRAQRGYNNAIANFAVFAPLALAVPMVGAGTELTGLACMMYFFIRLGHYVVYALGLPLIRTLLFFAGVGCQLVLAHALILK